MLNTFDGFKRRTATPCLEIKSEGYSRLIYVSFFLVAWGVMVVLHLYSLRAHAGEPQVLSSIKYFGIIEPDVMFPWVYTILLCPIFSLPIALFLWALLYAIPRSILAKQYDVAPRSIAKGYFISGVMATIAGGGLTLNSYLSTRVGGYYLIYVGLLFAGVSGVIQGMGILFFRSRYLGIVALTYLMVIWVAILTVWLIK